MQYDGGKPGVKQRAAIRLSDEEVDDFLLGRNTMVMSTIGPDGAIHSIAMWYALLRGNVAFVTKAKAQKVLNLRRDPRITCLVEDGDTYGTLRGVELVGRATISDDPADLLAAGVSLYERYTGPYDDSRRPAVDAMLRKRVAISVSVDRVVSWDHRKLGR